MITAAAAQPRRGMRHTHAALRTHSTAHAHTHTQKMNDAQRATSSHGQICIKFTHSRVRGAVVWSGEYSNDDDDGVGGECKQNISRIDASPRRQRRQREGSFIRHGAYIWMYVFWQHTNMRRVRGGCMYVRRVRTSSGVLCCARANADDNVEKHPRCGAHTRVRDVCLALGVRAVQVFRPIPM